MSKNIIRILVIILLLYSEFLWVTTEVQEEAKFSPMYNQLMKKLESLTPDESIEVKMGVKKKQYDIGDPFELRFQTNKDVYVIPDPNFLC